MSRVRSAGSGAPTRRRRAAPTPTQTGRRDGERADRGGEAVGEAGPGRRAGGDPGRASGGGGEGRARLSRVSAPPLEEEPRPVPVLRAVPLGRGLRRAPEGAAPRGLPRAPRPAGRGAARGRVLPVVHRLVGALLDLAEGFWSGAVPPAQFWAPTGRTEELAPGVVFLHAFANVTVLRTGAGLVLVDTSNYVAREKTFAAVRAIDPAPVHTAVYTHGHADHALGLPPLPAPARERGWPRPRIGGHKN